MAVVDILSRSNDPDHFLPDGLFQNEFKGVFVIFDTDFICSSCFACSVFIFHWLEELPTIYSDPIHLGVDWIARKVRFIGKKMLISRFTNTSSAGNGSDILLKEL